MLKFIHSYSDDIVVVVVLYSISSLIFDKNLDDYYLIVI